MPIVIKDNLKFLKLFQKLNFSDEFIYGGYENGKTKFVWQDHGIFGTDNSRIDFIFYIVTKDSVNPLIYHVKGKNRLKGNVCDFEGFIHITRIKRNSKDLFYCDGGDNCHDTAYQGRLLADYEFKENPNQFGSGVFRGIFSAMIEIRPNHLELSGFVGEFETSTYRGSYVGTWQDYKTNKKKKCIWTIGSIDFPFAGDFWIPLSMKEIEKHKKEQGCKCDIYSRNKKINPKYLNKGWADYSDDKEPWWEKK